MNVKALISRKYGVPTIRLIRVFESNTYYGSGILKTRVYFDIFMQMYYLAWNKDADPGEWYLDRMDDLFTALRWLLDSGIMHYSIGEYGKHGN